MSGLLTETHPPGRRSPGVYRMTLREIMARSEQGDLRSKASGSVRRPATTVTALLPDAELTENAVEDIVSVDRSDNVAEMLQNVPKFDHDQVFADSK